MELDLMRLLIWTVIGVAGGLFIYILGLVLFLHENMRLAKVKSEK